MEICNTCPFLNDIGRKPFSSWTKTASLPPAYTQEQPEVMLRVLTYVEALNFKIIIMND